MKDREIKPKPLEGCLRFGLGLAFLGVFRLMSLSAVKIDNVVADKMFVSMFEGGAIASGILGISILRGMTIQRFANEIGSELLNMSARGVIFYVLIELEKYYTFHH